MNADPNFQLSCPISISQYPQILLAHGGGGRLMDQLISKLFRSTFDPTGAHLHHDSTVLNTGAGKLAFTTDSYVVKPIFFPGGDIGKLAVDGTINDLAMSGAKPLFLSVAFILEEGFPIEDLWRVVNSLHDEAAAVGVQIVTGDTKVVDRGKGDGIFINTAGIGIVEHSLTIHPRSVQIGDAVIINGDLGRHGMAIMAQREGFAFESPIESDCAPLWSLVSELLAAEIEIHCLRDLTRGGLASALVEIAENSGRSISILEERLPIREEIQGLCELLGFDPIYVANEGRMALFLPKSQAGHALNVIRSHPLGTGAMVIGEVVEQRVNPVVMTTRLGTSRVIEMLSGEQLPRIC